MRDKNTINVYYNTKIFDIEDIYSIKSQNLFSKKIHISN